MPLLFLFKPTGISNQSAKLQFSEILSRQVELYKEAFGRVFSLRIHQVNSVLIGQIHWDNGIKDWTPWVEHGRFGLAWSGICESFLGADLSASSVEKIIDTVAQKPRQLLDWDGFYGVCTWDERDDTVRLTTGATETTSFWHTEGPNGWAVGNRALPLLELVGQQPAIDLGMASLYAGYGYLVGNNSMFKGVTRLPSRRQVVVLQGQKPTIQTYLPLDAYLVGDGKDLGWDEIVTNSAERILSRVTRQLSYSSNPVLLLTGGRDSRCIAAAAVKAGYNGVAQTSGPANSEDVLIAAQVAKALGITHQHTASDSHQSPLAAMVGAPDRLALWMQLNEGMETVRHVTAFQDFFHRKLPIPTTIEQKFHGLGGEIGRGYTYPINQDLTQMADVSQAYDIIVGKMRGNLKLQTDAKELLLETFKGIERETNGMQMTLAQWLDLFYWQKRTLQWGGDTMSVKSLMDWRWTPLFDRTLIQTAWRLRPEQKSSNQFIEAVTLKLQPALRGVTYNLKPTVPRKHLLKTIKLTLKKIARQTPLLDKLVAQDTIKKHDTDQHLLRFWQDVFFQKPPHVWPELIDKHYLDETLKRPTSEILWNLATVELVGKISTPVVAGK